MAARKAHGLFNEESKLAQALRLQTSRGEEEFWVFLVQRRLDFKDELANTLLL